MVIGTVISFLLLLVGVLNYANTMVCSIQNRKLSFAIMESVGMSRKQIDQQLMREGILYGGLSVLITLTAGTAVTYICFQPLNYMKIPFTVPPVPVFLAVILVIVICIITPVSSYRKLIGKKTVVERLRDYE